MANTVVRVVVPATCVLRVSTAAIKCWFYSMIGYAGLLRVVNDEVEGAGPFVLQHCYGISFHSIMLIPVDKGGQPVMKLRNARSS